MISLLFILVVNVVCNHGYLLKNSDDSTHWDHLSVKFLSRYSIPMNKDSALKDGWELHYDGCKEDNEETFKGQVYKRSNDANTLIIFDVNGLIGGIQLAIPKETKVANKWIGKAYFQIGNIYYITAYFTDISKMCRIDNKRDKKSVGDKLVIFNGKNQSMEIPLHEKDLLGTKWVSGKCFLGMGQHYWYGISKDMDCNDFFPVFLLYNGNQLDAFGFATYGALNGSHLEHPPNSLISLFFKSESFPKCLLNQGAFSTQHVYLNNKWKLC
ncbi:uncharacterized protein LOC100197948 isoform X1 [Hydra vulgaris]|uniref:uncharacterized protein LOC100197948 isoform X1 n=1 Tax=Hydra vulgaris TaxID=6087 RepID=UPI000192740E|nr:uncharacterized protein LOC100197948 isoform X1 [Hydra vulgaris]